MSEDIKYQKRKHPRLKGYDYSCNGCYFVTVCINDKKHLLGQVHVGRDAHIPPYTVYRNQVIQNFGYQRNRIFDMAGFLL